MAAKLHLLNQVIGVSMCKEGLCSLKLDVSLEHVCHLHFYLNSYSLLMVLIVRTMNLHD